MIALYYIVHYTVSLVCELSYKLLRTHTAYAIAFTPYVPLAVFTMYCMNDIMYLYF